MSETSRLTPSLLALAALFTAAGITHFAAPQFFERIVPPALPLSARTATLISGAAELMGGLSLLHPGTRPVARWGLLALLLTVFPANIYMAQDPQKFGVPAWVAWVRLPLQPLLMWLVWRAGRQRDQSP
ncbi:DoxX family protein [Deinococcus humi]|uniref:Putative membrane protein n=1 Tax=Deinococcus humi TaxID=662880 RepID=A0A7W8JZW9_9DEIO|nr:hypothetical protein [Deinococcus humi]MBB5365028.1 putative membrane protein [Deinococcus humi]GGO34777.1 hypothetical protein GCM10008949_36060 [Deinococcus humi]